MSGWAVPALAAGAILLAASYGLYLRFRRGALWGPGCVWLSACLGAVGALVAIYFFESEAGEPWALAGFLAGSVAGFLALGLDEIFDRYLTTFYACVRREVRALFTTPIPYFVLFIYVLVSGLFFWASLQETQRVGFRDSFDRLAEFSVILFPLLTMGALSRERSEGTIEVLLTASVSERSVVASKFVGTMVFYLAMIAPTLVYYVVLREIGREIGKPDPGPVYSAYLGMILSGGLFISIGLFASALTSRQILAAILSWLLLLILRNLKPISNVLGFGGTTVGDALEYMDPVHLHLAPFLRGIIDPQDVVYYLSFTVFFLFLASLSLQSRRWR